MAIISDFISRVQKIHKTGSATEHSYRPALEALFNGLAEGVTALNEPKRIDCGAPDFIIQRGEIAIGHVEAKDVGIGVRGMKDANKNQQERYRAALPNLIYTNCLDWDFYRNGELIATVTIADYLMGIQPSPDKFDTLENLLRDFIAQRPQTITSPRALAEIMAAKAVLIKDILHNALNADKGLETELTGQYGAFREHLIHDISVEDFADMYAETIAYGMFAARLHDTTLDNFSRQEAMELLPKSNPFLRSLFGYIAGHDLDERISWIIDDLAAVFQAANVARIMEGFGKLTGQRDPFLHFYETFLAAYNPAKRKARGVWYTPEAVVNFIVRAVDSVLKTEFGLPDGLADTSKVTVDWDTGQRKTTKEGKLTADGKNYVVKKEVHRVQILDPATGTGTFLAEAIKQIAPKIKDVAEGVWSQYVERDLIPRIHGFELLMASYAMCHMKLDMILTEMGYKPTSFPPRLSVYLTNSLEEGDPPNQTLPFAQWLSNEVKHANAIKRDMPIMCVIGNPPYSGISHNTGSWITRLIEDYKYVDGVHFGERKHWLQDDYVKFIRFSERLIEKNGEGVLGFITNHGYLGNPTFRGMRWHLMQTFDKIYVLDLHGNSKKKEVTPEGRPDKNVFDIQQGVAIMIAVKHAVGKVDKSVAEVFHAEFWGSREDKYAALQDSSLSSPIWKKLEVSAPQYALVRRDNSTEIVYTSGFSVVEFMPTNVTGIVTAKDRLVIDFTKGELEAKLSNFIDTKKDDQTIRHEFFGHKKAGKYPSGDSRGWKLGQARKNLSAAEWKKDIVPLAYRPFDTRSLLYRADMVDWGRYDVMPHMLYEGAFGLATARSNKNPSVDHFFVANAISEAKFAESSTQSCLFPLYLYSDDLDQTRTVNFNPKLYARLQRLSKHPVHGVADEVETFDYIYGVLYCPTYREIYADFLKADYPRIPWPATPAEFWDISAKGNELRRLHLMEADAIGSTPYPFKGEGETVVGRPFYSDGKVWINETQYFDAAPKVSWEFYIGGYQPAQKWLKDRKGRALTFEDIKHYQRILKILSETDRVMQTITMTLDAGETEA